MDPVNKQHLIQRRQTWYVQLRVPADLVPVIGKHLLCRSLKTRDLREANRQKHAVLAEFHSLLRRAECKPAASDPGVAYGKLLLDKIQAGKMYPEDALAQYDKRLSESTAEFLEANPDKWIADLVSSRENQTLQGLREAIGNGKQYALLSEAIEQYLNSDDGRLRVATLRRRRTYLNGFKDWQGDCGLDDITKADAGRYVTEVLEPSGRAAATIKQGLGDLYGFFQWCCGRGMSENNPFDGISRTVRTVKRGVRASGEELRPWSDEELVQLLTQTPQDCNIWVMSVLALYTGMRENELAEAKCDDVLSVGNRAVGIIDIPEAKTKAGIRSVPVHPVIAPLVEHLLGTSTDGYLVSGLKAGGYDGKRNHAFVKRFSYHKRVKLKLPTAVQFHGLRKNFSTQLYRAGVPVDRIEQIIGHSGGTLAQDVYIDGALPAQLAQDVSQLSHGDTITGIVTQIVNEGEGV